MGSGRKSQSKLQRQIEELELKKHRGLIQCLAAIIIATFLVAVKVALLNANVEWANTEMVNLMFFLTMIVAAAFAGTGSHKWKKAKDEIYSLERKRKK